MESCRGMPSLSAVELHQHGSVAVGLPKVQGGSWVLASAQCRFTPQAVLWGEENLIRRKSIKPTPVKGFKNKISLQRRRAGKISSLDLATFSEPMLNWTVKQTEAFETNI